MDQNCSNNIEVEKEREESEEYEDTDEEEVIEENEAQITPDMIEGLKTLGKIFLIFSIPLYFTVKVMHLEVKI